VRMKTRVAGSVAFEALFKAFFLLTAVASRFG